MSVVIYKVCPCNLPLYADLTLRHAGGSSELFDFPQLSEDSESMNFRRKDNYYALYV